MEEWKLIIKSFIKVELLAIVCMILGHNLGLCSNAVGGIYAFILIICAIGLFIYLIYRDMVYFIKLDDNAKIPTKRKGDGCYDLYACLNDYMVIGPHETKLVPTGIASVFNPFYRIAFRERGSNTKWNGQIMAGQIDSNYRGEYFIAVHNCGEKDIILSTSDDIKDIEVGARKIVVPVKKKALCQFAIERVPNVCILEETQEFLNKHKSDRGKGKLGSSGK